MSLYTRPVPAILFLLAGCGLSGTPTGTLNDDLLIDASDPASLRLAEDLALDAVLGPDGPAAANHVDALLVRRVEVDELGLVHVRMQQHVGNVPVFGGDVIVHLDRDGAVLGFTDELRPDMTLDVKTELSSDEAAEIAADEVGGFGVMTDDPQMDLYALRHQSRDHLVWRVKLYRLDGSESTSMPVIFVDAHTGEIVWSYDNLQTATGPTNYYGTVSFNAYSDGTYYYTEDMTRGLGTYSWGNTSSSLYYVASTSTSFSDSWMKSAVEAHYGAAQTYDYYATVHGRDGIDGAGGPAAISSHGYNLITSTVNYGVNYGNAYWDGSMMVYGDGDGSWLSSLTTLDIAGHEMTHGVTEYTAGLVYSGESGGLNESMSDVFGAMVERYALGESADTWLVGEDAWTPGTSGDALRYMANPAADGASYDYYWSGVGSADVHYSSGIPNLAFYLVAQGGSHPTRGGTALVGIGADAAADIWYLALTSYMTSTTDFAGARTATISAAEALYGASSTEALAVQNAWAAVGVGSSAPTCTVSTYTGSFSKGGSSTYKPSSSGTSVSAGTQTLSLSGPSGSNFDLYLMKKSGSSWSTVASSKTTGTSTESITYAGSSGTYRARVYSKSGTGSWSLDWCRP